MTNPHVIPESAMPDLTQALVQIWQQCIDNGMQLPFLLCNVGINGWAYIARFHGQGTEIVELAEYCPPGGMAQLPIHIIIVDQNGEAAHVALTAKGAVRFSIKSGKSVPAGSR